MSIRPWLKIRQSYIDDPVLGALPEEIQLRFYKLYFLAGQYELDGVIPLTLDQIAWKLRITPEQLRETFAALPHDYFSNNGSGPDITIFRREQVPQVEFEKQMQKNREKGERYRDNHKQPVSNRLVTGEESESESESDSQESESDQKRTPSNQSSLLQAPESQRPATDRTGTEVWHSGLTRMDFLKTCGIPSKLAAQIARDPQIFESDILAELARNYARKGTGRGQVNKPGTITGMNLAKHELPDQEWYQPVRWEEHLPSALLQQIGLFSEEENKEVETCSNSGYTQDEENQKVVPDNSVNNLLTSGITALEAWDRLKGLLENGMPKVSFDTWVKDTLAISYNGKTIMVGVRNPCAQDWLDSHLSAKVHDLIPAISGGQPINVEFITGGSQ